jgi:hypothetical protein
MIAMPKCLRNTGVLQHQQDDYKHEHSQGDMQAIQLAPTGHARSNSVMTATGTSG